jgi:hypothetical protein
MELHVIFLGDVRNAYKIVFGNHKGWGRPLGDIGVDGRFILKWT